MLTTPNTTKICIAGLGYVGLTLAVSFAEVGFQVYGVDKNPETLKLLNEGKPHFFEPRLDDLLKFLLLQNKISFHESIPVIDGLNTYIIAVGTPLDENYKVNKNSLIRVTDELQQHLKNDDLVILRSTVGVGTSRKTVYNKLKESGLQFDFAFCPERTLEGAALPEIRQLPQIVSGVNESSRLRATNLFSTLTPIVIQVSNIETAELIKLVDNTYRDVKFAYANEVASICDKIGVDASEVIKLGRLGYKRTDVADPGLVGGPCLQKDSYIFAESVREHGVIPEITMLSRQLNEQLPIKIINRLKIYMFDHNIPKTNLKIFILGFAFKGKPATNDVRGSMTIPIIESLRANFTNPQLSFYDPMVTESQVKEYNIPAHDTIEAGFTNASLVIIANNNPMFAGIPIGALSQLMRKPGVIYDCWGNFKTGLDTLSDDVDYIIFGDGSLARAQLQQPEYMGAS